MRMYSSFRDAQRIVSLSSGYLEKPWADDAYRISGAEAGLARVRNGCLKGTCPYPVLESMHPNSACLIFSGWQAIFGRQAFFLNPSDARDNEPPPWLRKRDWTSGSRNQWNFCVSG